MEPFYRKIFKSAWRISWKNKWLWFFGFFATFLGGGTLYETVIRSFSNLSEGRSIFYTLKEYANTSLLSVFSWTKIVDIWQTDKAVLIVSLFSILILAILATVFIILAIVSQSGLVKSSVLLHEKRKVKFKDAFSQASKKFWPVFGMNVLMKIVFLGVILFLAFLVSLMVIGPRIFDYILYTGALVILIVLAIIVYFLTIYGVAFVVLRDRKIWSAVVSSWHIFKNNLILNIEFGLILFIFNMVIGLLMIVACLFVLSPFILLYFLLIVMNSAQTATIIGGVIIIIFCLIVAVTGSWFTTFQISSWSLIFEELAMKRGKSKLHRVIEHLTLNKRKKKAKKRIK
jgi:hypothetical protein